jgi:tetratricopeptide (TPR) repeat protein
MKTSIKVIIIVSTCALLTGLAITAPFTIHYIKNFSPHKISKQKSEKLNSHFNRNKIQEIFANDSLPRKQKAVMANNMGYQLFKKNRYGEAIEYYQFAIEYDNTFITAHHNLACALLKEDVNCRMYSAFNEILFELRLDPLRKETISNDSNLIPLRLTKAYSILHNGFPQTDSLLKIILIGRWYKINKRVSEPDIHFGSNTKGTFFLINKVGKVEKINFSYYVVDRIITISFLNDSGKSVKKELQINYDMNRMILIQDVEGFDSWSEFDECDK